MLNGTIGLLIVSQQMLQIARPELFDPWKAGLLTIGYAVAIIAYALFGIGLAFYATPSTDAALSNLPASEAGAGAGIYKMASSLGARSGPHFR